MTDDTPTPSIITRHPEMFTSDREEYLTPDLIITAVVEVLGGIDLDPCADAGHNIPAKLHFTQNGTLLPWHGAIYMNPPYGRVIRAWIRKLRAEEKMRAQWRKVQAWRAEITARVM